MISPPQAAPRPVVTDHFGRQRVDDYDWLRDKESPDVLAHLEAENAYTEAKTEHLAPLRERIFSEIKDRTQETDLSVPYRRRGYWYYSRSFEGRDYPASCRVAVTDADNWTPPQPDEAASVDRPALPGEEVLLDLNELAEGHDFFSLGGLSLSPDDQLLAYAADVVGDERYTVRIKDLASGELLGDELTDVMGGATWDARGENLYYVTVDAAWRPDTVWRHRLGTEQSADEQVFHEPDQRFTVGVGRTRSERFLMIVAASKTSTEYHVLDAEDPDGSWRCFARRAADLEYSLEHAVLAGQDTFLVLHNAAGADFELSMATADASETTPADWDTLIAYSEGTRIEDVDAFATHLVVNQRSAGLTQVRIIDLDDTATSSGDAIADDHVIGFDREVYSASGSGSSFEQPVVRVGYTSLATPPSVYDYHVASRELTLLKQTPVLGGYDPDAYLEQRLWATARDGVSIPISLVVRKDVASRVDEQPIPVHLYGYGAYEISIDPYFSAARLSVLDRGAAFAVAHVRGGGEMGRAWYDQGKMEHKTNTFSDFIACAEHLVGSGWTTADRIVAEGGSAGGLLMGAVANMAPEAFGGIVAAVPFVDTLTSMLDDTLPLTVGEYDEWGNPAGDQETYDRIAGYAPYDNVTDQTYPPILAETSLHDTRVLFVEPAKWVARLRERSPQSDILLRTEMTAGHGGVSGRYKSWRDRAFSLAWILDRMGLASVDPT